MARADGERSGDDRGRQRGAVLSASVLDPARHGDRPLWLAAHGLVSAGDVLADSHAGRSGPGDLAGEKRSAAVAAGRFSLVDETCTVLMAARPYVDCPGKSVYPFVPVGEYLSDIATRTIAS